MCVYCLLDFDASGSQDPVEALVCGHVFHRYCLRNELQKLGFSGGELHLMRCPVCKKTCRQLMEEEPEFIQGVRKRVPASSSRSSSASDVVHAIEEEDGALVVSSLEAGSPISVVDSFEGEDRHAAAGSGIHDSVLVCDEEVLDRVGVGEASSQVCVDVTEAHLEEDTVGAEQYACARSMAETVHRQTAGNGAAAPDVNQSCSCINLVVSNAGDHDMEPALGASASAGEITRGVCSLQPIGSIVQVAPFGECNASASLFSCISPSHVRTSGQQMCSGVAIAKVGGGDASLHALSQLQHILLSYSRRGARAVVDLESRRVLGDAMLRYKSLVPTGGLVDAVDGLIRMRLVEEINERLTITDDGRAVDPGSETVGHGMGGWRVRSFRKRCWNEIAGDEVALREAERLKVGAGSFPCGTRCARS